MTSEAISNIGLFLFGNRACCTKQSVDGLRLAPIFRYSSSAGLWWFTSDCSSGLLPGQHRLTRSAAKSCSSQSSVHKTSVPVFLPQPDQRPQWCSLSFQLLYPSAGDVLIQTDIHRQIHRQLRSVHLSSKTLWYLYYCHPLSLFLYALHVKQCLYTYII